jgi:hypothetical protein
MTPHSHFCPRCSQHVHCEDPQCLAPCWAACTCAPCSARYTRTMEVLAASRRRMAASFALLVFLLAAPAFAKGHCSKKHPRPGCPPAEVAR